jgi:hypothetical protein
LGNLLGLGAIGGLFGASSSGPSAQSIAQTQQQTAAAAQLGIPLSTYQAYLASASSSNPQTQAQANAENAAIQNGTLGQYISTNFGGGVGSGNNSSGGGTTTSGTGTGGTSMGGLSSLLGGLLGGSSGGSSDLSGLLSNFQQASPSSPTPGSNTNGLDLGSILGQLITTPPFQGSGGGTTTSGTGTSGTGTGTSGTTASNSPLASIIKILTGGGSSSTRAGTNGTGSNILSNILSPALGIYGATQAQNTNQWNQAAKVSTLNYLQQLGSQAQSTTAAAQNSYLPQMESQINTSQGLLNNTQNQASSNINNALGSASGAFATGTQNPTSTVPGLQGVLDQLQGIQGQGSSAATNLQGNLTSGPVTNGLTDATNIASGNTSTQNSLNSLANLLTTGGTGVLGQPNAATQQAQNAAGSILGTNPLLSMDQVRSMAIDQNATQSVNAENALRQQELARTGVTGPALASGQQNELLGSGEDQALQNQASGLTAATLGQQNLQNQLYSTAANLYGSAQNATTQQQQTALQQLLGGAGILSGNQNSQVSSLNALSNLGGTQNQGYGTLSSLLNTLSGSSTSAGGLLTGASTLGNTQTNDLYNQLNSLLGNQLGLSGQAQTGLSTAASFPQNTANSNTNLLQSLASGNVGLFGNVPSQTAANNLYSPASLGLSKSGSSGSGS